MDNDPGKLSIKNPQKSGDDLQKILSRVIHLQDIVSLSQVRFIVNIILVSSIYVSNVLLFSKLNNGISKIWYIKYIWSYPLTDIDY